MYQSIEPVQMTIVNDAFVPTECHLITIDNQGTADVKINENISLPGGEYIVFPAVPGCIYAKRMSIKFGSTGTKKLVITKIINTQ